MFGVTGQQPDFTNLGKLDWEPQSSTEKVISGPMEDSGPDIFIDKSVLTALQEVSQKAENLEGFLGGQLVFSRFRPMLIVEHLYFYPLTSSRRQLDAEHINTAKDFFAEELPEVKLLGWFSMRSHKELGLSTHDQLLMQMFFGDHWQIAMLVDKQTGDCTVYSWQNGVLHPSRRVRTVETRIVDELRETTQEAAAAAEPALMSKQPSGARKLLWGKVVVGIVLLVFLAAAVTSFLLRQEVPQPAGILSSQVNESTLHPEQSSRPPTVIVEVDDGSSISQRDSSSSQIRDGPSSQAERAAEPIVSITAVASDVLSPNVVEYRVVSGDTLWEISKRFLGDGYRYEEIMRANPQITDPHRLVEGMILLIPIDSDFR